jgi:hypothetical protein
MSDEGKGLAVVATVLGIIASVVTIAAALKQCPCCGAGMPFQSYCRWCGHRH